MSRYWRPLSALRVWQVVGLAMIVTVIYMSLQRHPVDTSGVQFGDKYAHMSAYCGLMAWFGMLMHRLKHWLPAVFFIAMGISLEFVQGWLGYRAFELADMAANTVGVALGYALCATTFQNGLQLFERRLGFQ